MKKQILIFIIGIIFFINIIGFISADTIQKPTGNEIVPLIRGDNPGILMDSGKMYTLYYVADGKPATIQYSESFASYFFGKKSNQNSLIALSIYSAPWFDKKYTLVKNTNIDLFTKKTSLSLKQGVYKFEFKAYGHDWASVNLKIN